MNENQVEAPEQMDSNDLSSELRKPGPIIQAARNHKITILKEREESKGQQAGK